MENEFNIQSRQHHAMKNAIIIGAGIVGLATARALAVRGCKVTVFERSQQAVGASVRNFGMVWPIGQPTGEMYETALRSRAIWKKSCTEAGIWHNENGSLHLAYHDDEWAVLEEFVAENQAVRPAISLLSKKQVRRSSLTHGKPLRSCPLISPKNTVSSFILAWP